MATNYDIIVVGAGSNSLLTAAYLARAGKNVLVLEKNDQCGGGVVSIEYAPGFIGDPHAVGFGGPAIASPITTNDELELISKHGLKWITSWDATMATMFNTGDSLISYHDLDKSCEEIARYSQKDAEAYRRLVKSCQSLGKLLGAGSATPPMPTGPFITMLDGTAEGRRLLDMMFMSAYDILENLFESPEVRMHFYKFCGEYMESPETKGTGTVMIGLTGFIHSIKPHVPQGGSREVTNAIIRCFKHHGGTLRTLAEVSRINIQGGRATGVTLSDGEVINAKDAVVANIHPWRLAQVIPEVDPGIAEAARHTKLSNHGAINQQIALSEWPIYKSGQNDRMNVSICKEFADKDELGMRKVFDHYRYGEIPQTHISPLAVTNSCVDPTRVPSPDKCSLYLYHFAPRVLRDGGIEGWKKHGQAFADAVWEYFKSYTTNIDDSKVIARYIETPLDHHNHSHTMLNGDIFGIGGTFGQSMGRRPIVELAQYRIPGIEALYLAGCNQHPGGSVTFGGRTTAMKMMMDWKMDLKKHFIL